MYIGSQAGEESVLCQIIDKPVEEGGLSRCVKATCRPGGGGCWCCCAVILFVVSLFFPILCVSFFDSFLYRPLFLFLTVFSLFTDY